MIRAVRNSLFVAWRYLAYHRARSAVLVVALAIIVFVPVFLDAVAKQSRRQLTARADATPLLLGAPGSALDLVMNSLYFTRDRPRPIDRGAARAIDDSGLALAIPLDTRHRAGGHTIAGTTLDYFEFRGLEIAAGRPLAILGDAVLGARVAETNGLAPGDSVISTPETVFDIAGQYPLRLNVVGVLAPTGTPDDHVIFVDLRTSWIIDGIGHGHQDLAKSGDASVILKRDDGEIVANAKLQTYTVISPETLDEFHFHGVDAGFPITAAIALPTDQRAKALLLGRYQEADTGLQLVRPARVAGDLIATIFRLKRMLDAVVATVAFATVLTVALVFMLSYRLRARELTTIFRLGCSRGAIAGFVAAEIALIAAVSAALAFGLLALAGSYLEPLMMRLFA